MAPHPVVHAAAALYKLAGRPGTRSDLLAHGAIPAVLGLILADDSASISPVAAGHAAGVLLRLVTHGPSKAEMLRVAGGAGTLRDRLSALARRAGGAEDKSVHLSSTIATLFKFLPSSASAHGMPQAAGAAGPPGATPSRGRS